ncbi:MAG TPA: Gfo/Idh/MocA family oxidoreductase [Thermodesulfobacteriota bacterium]|nr:Gfo/Idh/MocA family oxidoreductase [Thermodesulfobacteriota bacterium]
MEKEIDKKNIACIGAGYWGKNLVRNFAALGVLHTICDRNDEILKNFKETYPGVLLKTNVKEVLKDSAIHGVVIATPAETHFGLVKQALEMEKDVLVEKPLALSVKQGEELVSLARIKGKILMVGHILAYHPGILKLKELVNKGELGKINYIYSNRLNLGKFRKEENILWSFAPHDISVILMLLGEMPLEISASGGTYLQPEICDVTVTNMRFASGVRSHIFVSWLHPFKEQKLIVVGDNKMAVFDDVAPKDKLLLFEHKIDWIDRQPIPRKEDARVIELPGDEPLREECVQFVRSIATRQNPPTDGEEGVRVLRVLEASQKSLKNNGLVISLATAAPSLKYFVHETGIIDGECFIGEGTKIWHFSHLMEGAVIGKNCSLGQNVFIGRQVTIGNNVKIQNNVSVFEAVTLEDNVFCGPSCVFTNVLNPRSLISRKDEFRNTLVKEGATIGANATIVCGNTIGRFAFIGAGAVITENVPDFALVYGNPGKIHGWMCACGFKLLFSSSSQKKTQRAMCSACGKAYEKTGEKVSPVG